ncbi:hypothetical protein D3C85_1772170 [compost metagenome]
MFPWSKVAVNTRVLELLVLSIEGHSLASNPLANEEHPIAKRVSKALLGLHHESSLTTIRRQFELA